MKKKLFFSVCLSLPLALFPLSAPAEEGSPLLSVDDLIALEDSYEAFLNELGDLAVQRVPTGTHTVTVKVSAAVFHCTLASP